LIASAYWRTLRLLLESREERLIITLRKDAPPTKANADRLHGELTSLIPGHVNNKEPWTFYDEIDAFLGPWGEKGYPLAYGKYYCKLFNGDPNLHANLVARQWVEQTTIKLQEALRDGIVYAFAHGKLPKMTEAEFRAFAFDTHPQVYQRAGLIKIIESAPYLLPVIIAIPGKEFIPFYSDNFMATIIQALDTAERMTGDVTAGIMPVHSGKLMMANEQSGMNRLLAIDRRNREYEATLSQVRAALASGRLDRIATLEQVAGKLRETAFEDAYWLGIAKSIMSEIQAREHAIAERYRAMSKGHPEVGLQIQKFDPTWARY